MDAAQREAAGAVGDSFRSIFNEIIDIQNSIRRKNMYINVDAVINSFTKQNVTFFKVRTKNYSSSRFQHIVKLINDHFTNRKSDPSVVSEMIKLRYLYRSRGRQ